MLPYWYDAIVPDLAAGRTVLVVAHGNSLRALVKHLDEIGDAEIAGLDIPTGMPLVYEIDAAFRPVTQAGATSTRRPRPKARRRSRTRADDRPGAGAVPWRSVARPGPAWPAVIGQREHLANNGTSGTTARCAPQDRGLPSKRGYGGDYRLGGCASDKWMHGQRGRRHRPRSASLVQPRGGNRCRMKIRVPLKTHAEPVDAAGACAAAARRGFRSVGPVLLGRGARQRGPGAAGQRRGAGVRAGPRRRAGRAGTARPGPPGPPGRRDPRGRDGGLDQRRQPADDELRGAGRPAGRGRRRRRPGAAADRGPDREPPGGGGPAGLRGQHQPRAEDPGRRARAAGRDGRGRRRRPGGGAPVRRPHAAGGVPAHQPGAGHDHAVPDPGGRADPRPGPGRAGRGRGRGAGPVPDEGERARHRARGHRRARPVRARRRGPAGHRAAQPPGERGRLQPGQDPGRRVDQAGRRRRGRDQRGRPGHRDTRA